MTAKPGAVLIDSSCRSSFAGDTFFLVHRRLSIAGSVFRRSGGGRLRFGLGIGRDGGKSLAARRVRRRSSKLERWSSKPNLSQQSSLLKSGIQRSMVEVRVKSRKVEG